MTQTRVLNLIAAIVFLSAVASIVPRYFVAPPSTILVIRDFLHLLLAGTLAYSLVKRCNIGRWIVITIFSLLGVSAGISGILSIHSPFPGFVLLAFSAVYIWCVVSLLKPPISNQFIKGKSESKLLIIVCVAVFILFSLRSFAANSALKIGSTLGNALMTVSFSGFSDTKALEHLFTHPEISGPTETLERLIYIAPDWLALQNELKADLIYLSKQASLAPDQRFKNPPHSRYLSIATSNNTNKGVSDSAFNLLIQYMSQFF
jgi:hypothetical protein